ncbi:four-carbon acid sugar kinase family protein [Fulvimarina sp. MAC8]|uniref:four-carbon acid sugar kinase family protein n=1 Tax=Fulvimarina sp. MAC8 TaxID=3162874 RepID=UPI0032EE60B8
MSSGPRLDGGLPDGPLVAFYGDDFTGSSAVMEVMTFAGLPTVMFLEAPGETQLARFADHRVIGIASTARAETPQWMDETLPGAFAALKSLNAPINHYKICSTFDSSPEIGSIGRAIDLGASVFSPRFVPLVTGAPAIRRYQAFGHLFAAHAGQNYRLDRHPSMSRHPATPMDEADLARHLSRQTDREIGLVDLAALKTGEGRNALEAELNRGCEIVSFDVLDEETLAGVGALIWQERETGPIFAAGSQGLEYALIAHWRRAGILAADPPRPTIAPVDRIAVVSGSVSPTTAGQIEHAATNGFELIAADLGALETDTTWQAEVERLAQLGLAVLAKGKSPLIASARGPDDPAVARLEAMVEGSPKAKGAAQRRLSKGLGQVLKRLLDEAGIGRAVICGGDTSSFAAKELGIEALSALAPAAPGAPLCKAYGSHSASGDFEIALKGGQMGAADYLTKIRDGTS